MDNNEDCTTETRDESGHEEDEDEKHTANVQPEERASLSNRKIEKQEDTEEDDEDSLHTVSSVREIKHSVQLITLEEGTYTTATETDSYENVAKIERHICFEQIVEERAIPAPSTSEVVENVREYVKQIDKCMENAEIFTLPRCSTTTPRHSAAEIVEPINKALTLETIKYASDLSFTSKQSDDSFSQLSEIERIAHDEVERIVAENEEAAMMCASECPDFKQVERENKEIAERFKQIMEMFDSFTKNLESLEMPAISQSTEEVVEKAALPLRRRLSFKGIRSADRNEAGAVSAGASGSGSVYNEFCLEVHGDLKNEPEIQDFSLKSYNTPSCSSYTQRVEAALDPMYRDIATTVSGLELLSEFSPSNSAKKRQYKRDVQNLSTIGCQTTGDYYTTMQACTTGSTSFSNFHVAPKAYTQTYDDDVVNALIIDSITDGTTSACTGAVTATFTDTTETSNITVVQPSTIIHGTTDQSALVKIREPPTIIDLTQDTRVTSVVTDAAASDAPCERNYHTIHIEANTSPPSSEMRRPPLCSRLWNVITDFCAAVCLCLQVNKDCLFCLGFFIAFVVSASFLTAFFYRTLSINPQIFQTPAAPPNIAHHVNALHGIHSENSVFGL
ncbi:uncharacterized protein [Eurosta solidaginis]|uniref:uncharacterized protein n=1 Tax=Eurosta solidaginis TaxID=178769 RepID=UPI003530BE2D